MKNKNICKNIRRNSIDKLKSVFFLFLGLVISVNVNAQITLSATGASAVGVNDGQAIVQATSGVGNYTYTWSNASTGLIVQGPTTNILLSDTLSNALSGSYILTFTDNGSVATIMDTITISAPGGSFAFDKDCDILVTDVTAFVSGCTYLNPVLGTQYILMDASLATILDTIVLADSIFLSALVTGGYTITALNLDNGCSVNGSLSINSTPITVTSSVANSFNISPSCDGVISASVLTGQFPYTFTLTNSLGSVVSSSVAVNLNATALCADIYCLNIEDGNACSYDSCFEVAFIPCDVNLSVSAAIPCSGGVGNIQVDVDTIGLFLGPVPFLGSRYTYTIFTTSPLSQVGLSQSSNANSAIFSGLFSDSYLVKVFDASYGTYCTSDSIILTQPNSLQIFTSIDSTSAPWINDGVITIDSIIGGTPGFAIQWLDSLGVTIAGNGMVQSGLKYSNSYNGGYTIIITDTNGCVLAHTEYVHPKHAADSLRIDSSSTVNVTCFNGNDGVLMAQLDSIGIYAIPPFTFQWKNAVGVVIRTDVVGSANYNSSHLAKYSGLGAGDYSLTVTDFYNNSFNFFFPTITEPLLLTVDLGPNFIIDCGEDTVLSSLVSGGNMSSDTVLISTNTLTLIGNPLGFQDTLIPGDNYIMVVTGTYFNSTGPVSMNHDAAYQYGPPSPVINWRINGSSPSRPVPDIYNLAHSYSFPFVASLNNIHQFSLPGTGNTGSLVFELYHIGVNVPVYNYSWTTIPASVPAVISTTSTAYAYPGITGKRYVLNVEDVLGCSASDVVRIDWDVEILNFSSVVTSNLACYGDTLGYLAMEVDSSTGFSPYTFYIDNVLSNAIVSNLEAGTYDIHIEDSVGCLSADSSISIIQPDSLYACGVDTVKVAVLVESFVMSFNSPFSHVLANSLSLGMEYRLVVSGTYNETWGPAYLDAAYQYNVSPALVSNNWKWQGNPIRPINDVYSLTHSYVYSMIGIASTASPEFSYEDNDGDYSANAGALTFDLYKMVCSDTDTAYTCYGDSTGTAYVSPIGGTPFYDSFGDPYYNVVWTNGIGVVVGSSETVTGLSSGLYTATITDSLGCMYERNLVVLQSALPLQVDSLFQVNVMCKGDSTGEIFALVSGGFTTNYAILVNGIDTIYNSSGLLDTIHIINLPAGNYDLYLYDTIPDAQYGIYGCPQNIQVEITEPQNHLTSNINLLSDVLCYGDSSGIAIVTAIGGQFPYTYFWDSNFSGTIANNLWAGLHTVEITDSNDCVLVDSITIINQHPEILGTINIIQNVSCFGACDAIVELSSSGGVLQHEYDWDTGPTYYGSGPDTSSNLCFGGHDVIVTDALGCTKVISFSVSQPDELFAQATMVEPVQCYGQNDGIAIASATGGTLNYSFVWDNINGVVGPNIDNLTPGIHTVFITDTNGCTAADTVMISEPSELIVQILDSMTIYSYCLGTNSGQLCALASGGTPNNTPSQYAYVWDDLNYQTTSCAYNLIADVYTVMVADARGCIASATYDLDSITSAMDPDSVTFTVNDVSCFGGYNGSIAINSVVGAQLPLAYAWTGCGGFSSTLPIITSLSACSYAVVITDSNGCTITVNAEVGEPDQLEYTTYNVIEESCYGACNGEVWVNVTGGTGNYYYDLSELGNFGIPAANQVQLINDSLIVDLCQGSHSIYITDDNNCEGAVIWGGSWEEIVDSGVVVTIPGVSTNNASCASSNDGEAWIQWPGANSLFTYTWETISSLLADTGVSTTILYPGDYVLIAHYADSASFGQVYQGCDLISNVFTITAPLPIISGVIVTDVSCFDDANGSIALAPSGGLGTYTYLWDITTSIPNPSTLSVQTGLLPGTYTVTITDTNSCELTESIVVSEPDPITAILSFTEPLCHNDNNASATVSPDGGTPGWTYAWSPSGDIGATATNLIAQNHNVTVTDANGCSDVFSVVITQPAQIISSVEANTFFGEDDLGNSYQISCHGLADGSAIVVNGGGVAPITYLWDDVLAQTTSQANNLSAGIYTVTVQDANSCIENQTVTLFEPDTIVAHGLQSGDLSAFGFDISCYGLSDGWVELVPTGGVTFNGGIYQYAWSGSFNGQSTMSSSVNNIVFGNYSVTITDANGCKYDTSFVLTQPADTFIAVVNTVNYAGPAHPSVTVLFKDSTITPNTSPADPIDHIWFWNMTEIEPFINSAFNTFSYTFTEIGANYVYVLVQNANTGCIDTVNFTIEVQGVPEINNVFSPNGDGINDEFIFGEYGMKSVEINIYNRWGEQVYSWEGDGRAWDGKGADGQDLPEAVYFYILNAEGEDGRYYEEKGAVTIMR